MLDRIVVQHSKAGNAVGERWSKGSGAGLNGTKDQDKEWLAVSPSGDRVALCWTEFDHYGSEAAGDSTRILCSTTGRKAKKWTEPVSVSAMEGNCLDGDSTVEGAVPVWIDEMTLGVAWAHGEHIRWNVSEDAGVTFRSYEQYIADIIGGWDQVIPGIGRANGMPVTGVAREGCARREGVCELGRPAQWAVRYGCVAHLVGRQREDLVGAGSGQQRPSGQASVLHLDGGGPGDGPCAHRLLRPPHERPHGDPGLCGDVCRWRGEIGSTTA